MESVYQDNNKRKLGDVIYTDASNAYWTDYEEDQVLTTINSETFETVQTLSFHLETAASILILGTVKWAMVGGGPGFALLGLFLDDTQVAGATQTRAFFDMITGTVLNTASMTWVGDAAQGDHNLYLKGAMSGVDPDLADQRTLTDQRRISVVNLLRRTA